jgi:hypothetical protein
VIVASKSSQVVRYLWCLGIGLLLLAILYVPIWFGAYQGEASQWYVVPVALFCGLPGFVLVIVGAVGAVIESIKDAVVGSLAKKGSSAPGEIISPTVAQTQPTPDQIVLSNNETRTK